MHYGPPPVINGVVITIIRRVITPVNPFIRPFMGVVYTKQNPKKNMYLIFWATCGKTFPPQNLTESSFPKGYQMNIFPWFRVPNSPISQKISQGFFLGKDRTTHFFSLPTQKIIRNFFGGIASSEAAIRKQRFYKMGPENQLWMEWNTLWLSL